MPIERRVVPGVSPRFMEAMSWMLSIRPHEPAAERRAAARRARRPGRSAAARSARHHASRGRERRRRRGRADPAACPRGRHHGRRRGLPADLHADRARHGAQPAEADQLQPGDARCRPRARLPVGAKALPGARRRRRRSLRPGHRDRADDAGEAGDDDSLLRRQRLCRRSRHSNSRRRRAASARATAPAPLVGRRSGGRGRAVWRARARQPSRPPPPGRRPGWRRSLPAASASSRSAFLGWQYSAHKAANGAGRRSGGGARRAWGGRRAVDPICGRGARPCCRECSRRGAAAGDVAATGRREPADRLDGERRDGVHRPRALRLAPSPSATVAAGMAASLLNGATSRTAPGADDGALRSTIPRSTGTEVYLGSRHGHGSSPAADHAPRAR